MNDRVKKIETSGIRKFHNKVAKVPGAISLTLGQPDFKTPDVIKEAMIKAIDDDKNGYTSNEGIEPLREEISKYLKKKNINFSKDEICITAGGSEALYAAFQGLFNSDDRILIPNPAFPAYKAIADILGLNVIEYDLNEDFMIDVNKLKKLIRKNHIKGLMLSYPSNPTGAILTEKLKEDLHELLKDEDIYIISDEIYAELIYENEYLSLAQYEDILDKIIYVSGFSKMFSMTGLRLGYVCAKRNLLDSISKVHQYNVSCAPSIVQWGAFEGLRSAMDDVSIMRDGFKERRDYCYTRLKAMGLDCILPLGAFYIFPSIEKFNLSSEEFCTDLLNKEKIACVPGSAFGSRGDYNVRISYCYSMEELEKALDGIERWIKDKR